MILGLDSLLFHGTSIQNVERILRSDTLQATSRLPDTALPLLPGVVNVAGDQPIRVASLSRSISAARGHSSAWTRVSAAILAFDEDSLRREIGHRLFSYNDLFTQSGTEPLTANEQEEAIAGHLEPAGRYVRHILIFKKGLRDIDAILAEFPLIADHPGLIVLGDQRNMSLSALRHHLAKPLLRRSQRFGLPPKRLKMLQALSRLR